ncbi:MAG TPA: energy transducer TonB [Sphingobium sp.]
MLREADSVRVEEDVATTFAPALAMSAPQGAVVTAVPSQRYGEGKPFNWPGAILTALLHVALIAAFFLIKNHVVQKREARLTVVNLTPAAPPPPSTPEQPTPQKVAVVTPRPVVQIPQPSPVNIPTTPDPVPQPTPPALPTASTAPPAPPAPPSVIQSNELGTRMIAGSAPRYPLESRRKHEVGTVVLTVTIGLDGRVVNIGVSKSSGFARLDDAALSAVRKWRWAPIVEGGQPVMVRGYIPIPFELQG